MAGGREEQSRTIESYFAGLIAVPARLRAREMGVILTHDAAGRLSPGYSTCIRAGRQLPYVLGPSFPGLRMSAKKGRRNQSTGKCNSVGGVRNGVTEEDLCQGLNPSTGQTYSLSHMGVFAMQLRNEQKGRM